MSDGKVIIDTELNSKPIDDGVKKVKKSLNDTKNEFSETTKETQKFEQEMGKLKQQLGGDVPEATKEAYQNMYKLRQEIRNTSRQYGSYSQETTKAKNALNDYVLGLDDATFKQVYMRSSLGLTDAQLTQQANSIKLNARMIKLMGSQTEILTKQMEGLASKGIKPKDMLPASTLGQFQMLNETIKASGNPIYKLSSGYRALGTSMERTIKGWSAQKMAVKLAGDDMVKYGLLLRGITAGQASLAMAFPIVGIAAVATYGAIFSSAFKANEGLQQLADTVKGKLGQAFKPLLDTAGQFLTVVLNMVGKIADLMIKFNELHPIISKIVSVIALLAPAMTLLLLPLNMGIGLLAGWKVAINGAWVAIGGIASAIGIAASTFLTFATVIGAVVGGLIYLWNTNDNFKSAVLSAWSAISAKGQEVFGGLAKTFSTLSQAFDEGGFKGLLTAISGMITNMITTITSKAPELLKSGSTIIQNFLLGFQANLPQILAKGSEIITNLINGISSALPSIIEKMNETRIAILSAIASNLPQLIQTGVQIITTLIKGIADTLPTIINIGLQIITTLLDTITNNLPAIINLATNVIMTLINGLVDALPYIIEIGINIILALVDAIIDNLPTLIDSTIKIINALINGIIIALPKLIEGGIKIIIALTQGLIQAIPQLIAAIPQIIQAIITGFASADWSGLGFSILTGLGTLIQPILTFFTNLSITISSFFTSTIPTFFSTIWTTITTYLTTLWTNIKTACANGWNNIVIFFTTTIPNLINSIGVWFSQLPNKISYALGYSIGTVAQWGANLGQWVSTNVPIIINNISTFFSELPSKIGEWLNNTLNSLVNWGSNMASEASNSASNAINSIYSWFAQLPSQIESYLSTTLSNLVAWGGSILASAESAGSSAINAIINWFSQLPSQISSFLSSALSALVSWGSSMISEASSSMSNVVSTIVSVLSQLPAKMVSIGSNIVAGIKSGISSAWSGMAGWLGGLCDSFIAGVKSKFDIHSPSRVMAEIGKFIIQGWQNGLVENSKSLIEKATNISENVVNAIQKPIKNLNLANSMVLSYSSFSGTFTNLGKQIEDANKLVEEANNMKVDDSITDSDEKQLMQLVIDNKKDFAKKQQDIANDNKDKLTEIAKATTEALTAQLEAEKAAEEKIYNDKLDLLEKEYNAETANIDKITKKKTDAIDEQIKALEQATTETSREEERQASNNNINTLTTKMNNTASIADKRALALQIKEAQKELSNKENEWNIEDEKAQLEQEKTVLQEKADFKKQNLQEEYNDKKTAMEQELKATDEYYDKLLEQDSINAQARYILLNSSNQELVNLLNSYNPNWQNAGQSLADSLLTGLNSSKQSVQDAVAELLSYKGTYTIDISSSSNNLSGYASGTNYNSLAGLYNVDENGFELASGNSVAYVGKGAAIKNHMQSMEYINSLVADMQNAILESQKDTMNTMLNSILNNVSNQVINNNESGLTLHIDNFNNNTGQDVEQLANELGFYANRQKAY